MVEINVEDHPDAKPEVDGIMLPGISCDLCGTAYDTVAEAVKCEERCAFSLMATY